MQNNNNQKQEQHQDVADPTSNEKEVTDHEETATSSTLPPPQVVYHSDVCAICQEDVSMMDVDTFGICTGCGKCMHTKCQIDLHGSNLSRETKYSCPMCRARNVLAGSKEDIRRLRKWTQKNKRWAQEMLGLRYDKGVGVPQDDKRAFVLYKLAADQGHHQAQFNLGTMYEQGQGVIQSDTLAYKYYQLSADQGFANAQFNVGADYYNGTSAVEQSCTKAREWWTKAAAQGIETAIKNLRMLDKREGRTTTSSSTVTDNTIACFKCNKPQTNTHKLKNCGCKAAKYCNSTCQTEHWQKHKTEHRRIVQAKGLINTEGEMKDEVTTDEETATLSTTHQEEEDEDVCYICLDALPKNDQKFTRMACCGKGMHQTCFAKKMKSKSMSLEQRNSCCLCRTKIPTRGSKEDLEQLRHFVKKGKGWSMAMLGRKYAKGRGVDQSWKQATRFYKMAIEHGDVGSMPNLAFIYYTGHHVEQDVEKMSQKDVEKAKELWMKAAALGNIVAIRNLKEVDKTEGKTSPSFTPAPTFCSYCGKAHNPPTSKLNACTGCRSVFYCCKEHQIKDWKLKQNGHKKECGELKELNKQYQTK